MKFESFTLKPERGRDPLYIWTLLIWHEQNNRKSLEFFYSNCNEYQKEYEPTNSGFILVNAPNDKNNAFLSSFFAFVSKLPVRGLPGVPGENVPLRVVEELMNVTERVQTRPQATEEQTVSGLQLLHNTAKAFIVQVRIDVLFQPPT